MRRRLAEKILKVTDESSRKRRPRPEPRRGTWLRAVRLVERRDPEVPRMDMLGLYKLVRGRAVPVPRQDLLHWATRMESRPALKQTLVGDRLVSTIFLGVDHNYGPNGPPILWETLVFRYPEWRTDERWGRRARTRAEALRDHDEIIKEVRGTQAHDEMAAALSEARREHSLSP